ncbi:hypothetical protein [Lentzea sp. NBRC 105346]|uniref:hypothetical protein n=1 Tax=Lentzea sp. NBRC 105346 TaxID=3032205 RepID=UPI002555B286|nr:hypothetical protein [Lentzea sp. NBRC 105346]
MAYTERIIVVGSGQVGVVAATRVAHRFGPVDLIGEVDATGLGEIGVRVYRNVRVKSVDLDTPALIVHKDSGRTQRLVCDRLVIADDDVHAELPRGMWVHGGKVVVLGGEHHAELLDECFAAHAGWRNALADYQWRRQAEADQLA